MLEILEKLAHAGIEIAPLESVSSHFCLARGGVVALVERVGDGFGKPGAAGLLTGHGFAALVWRGQEPWLVAKGAEKRAAPAEVAAIRQFSTDLERLLGAQESTC
jgi:hypothetical protein